jgi:hypothetical protein
MSMSSSIAHICCQSFSWWGGFMIKRPVRCLVGLLLLLVALLNSACANTEFYKDYKLTQPGNFWCETGAASPFPPYCHPDRW